MPQTATPTLNTLNDIETRHATLVTEATELLDRAGDNDLDGDNLTRYTEIETELDALKARKDRLTRLSTHLGTSNSESGDGTTARSTTNRASDPYDLNDRRYHGHSVKARALTAIEQTHHLDDTYKARATELVENIDSIDSTLARHIVLTGRPDYRTGWGKLVTGQEHLITTAEQTALSEARASSLTAGAGGYAVPFTLDSSLIINNAGTANPWRQLSNVSTIVTDDWNGIASAGVTASWAAEAAEATDNAPTITQPSISVHKAHAFVPFSIEIGADWPGFENEMRTAFTDAKDRLEATAFATGTGSGQPTGLITALVAASSPLVASATTDTFVAADVYSTLEGAPPRHRSAGSWVSNLSIINLIRQFGTANNYSNFLVDFAAGTPSTLLGRPLYESSDMDSSITATADNYVLAFGNFDRYKIVDRVGMTVELVPHLLGSNRRPSGQRGLYAYWRVGAGCTDTSAFALLNVT